MATASATYTLNIPTSDGTLLRTLAKKFGWVAKKQKTSQSTGRLDEALKDFATGNTKSFDTVDDLMNYLNS